MLVTSGPDRAMSHPSASIDISKGNEMFAYLVTTTDGYSVRIETEGDPTDHPALWGRVANVQTLGLAGLSLV